MVEGPLPINQVRLLRKDRVLQSVATGDSVISLFASSIMA
jgi:hypothetical protein